MGADQVMRPARFKRPAGANSSRQLAALSLFLLLANLFAGQITQATGSGAPIFLLNTQAARSAPTTTTTTTMEQNTANEQLIKSALEVRAHLAHPARQSASSQFDKHLSELIVEALDGMKREQRKRQQQQEQTRARARQQELAVREELTRRIVDQIEPVLQANLQAAAATAAAASTSGSRTTRISAIGSQLAQQEPRLLINQQLEREEPTLKLMVRELDKLPRLHQFEGREMEVKERSRRVMASAPSQSQRSLMALNQQLDSIQSLIDSDYARVYKPKSISTARGFGR